MICLAHYRIIKAVCEYLSDGPRNFVEIRDYVNERTRYGTTRHELSQVLSKHPQFVLIDTQYQKYLCSGSNIGIYDLSPAEKLKIGGES